MKQQPKITIFVAHTGNKVKAYSILNDLDSYLTSTTQVSTVEIDMVKWSNATSDERTTLVQKELKKKKYVPRPVMTVGKLKEIIEKQGISDDEPITFLAYNKELDESYNIAIVYYDHVDKRLELMDNNGLITTEFVV